ncbi:MAG: helix-turn-helix domain-containing protein [Gemmatimonadota bacterium]
MRWLHGDSRFRMADWTCRAGDTAPEAVEASDRPAISFSRRGVYRRHVGSRTLLLDPGTAVFYPPWMEYRVTHPLPGGDRSLVVALSESALDGFGVDRLPDGHAISSRDSSLLVRRVELAAREGRRLAVEELLVRLVRETLAALSGDHNVRRRNGTAAAHRRAVERAKEVMASRYGERLTLDAIARDSGYSAPHLCEVFREETGFTLHRYLRRLRLLVALESLEGPADLTRLSYEVGFSTPSHFSAAFRREFGHPPSRLLGALHADDLARSSGDFESGRGRPGR